MSTQIAVIKTHLDGSKKDLAVTRFCRSARYSTHGRIRVQLRIEAEYIALDSIRFWYEVWYCWYIS